MSVFERYLTHLGVAVHRGRHCARSDAARAVPGHRPPGSGAGQPAGGAADLGHDHPHAGQGGLRCAARGATAHEGHRRHAVRQLAGQALLHGPARLALHPPSVCAPVASRAAGQLHRRPDSAGGRTLHRHGLRLEPAHRRPPAVHADPSRAERRHHGVRLRAAGGAAAGPVGHHGALGHAADLGRALHRGAGDHRPALAPRPAGARPGGLRCRHGTHRALVHHRPAGHPGAAVRLPGRGHPAPAAGDRPAGSAHPDPGLLQFGAGLLV